MWCIFPPYFLFEIHILSASLSTGGVLDWLNWDRIICDLPCIFIFFRCRALDWTRGCRALLWRFSQFWQDDSGTVFWLFFPIGRKQDCSMDCCDKQKSRTDIQPILAAASHKLPNYVRDSLIPWELKHRRQYSSQLCLNQVGVFSFVCFW